MLKIYVTCAVQLRRYLIYGTCAVQLRRYLTHARCCCIARGTSFHVGGTTPFFTEIGQILPNFSIFCPKKCCLSKIIEKFDKIRVFLRSYFQEKSFKPYLGAVYMRWDISLKWDVSPEWDTFIPGLYEEHVPCICNSDTIALLRKVRSEMFFIPRSLHSNLKCFFYLCFSFNLFFLS